MKKLIIIFVVSLASTTPVISQELLLFGGDNRDTFLGCLTCNKYSSDAVCNKYGAGNKYSSDSIFNKYGTFGNKYSSSSPWNKYTSSDSVPVLVDRIGNFYGYFTINQYRGDSFSNSSNLAKIYALAEGNLTVVRNMICEER